jgi:hypothetical protein
MDLTAVIFLRQAFVFQFSIVALVYTAFCGTRFNGRIIIGLLTQLSLTTVYHTFFITKLSFIIFTTAVAVALFIKDYMLKCATPLKFIKV